MRRIALVLGLAAMAVFALSGVFFSTARFPEALQPWIRVLPLTALIDALRSVMGEGATIAAIGPQLILLVLWGVASFAVALRVFRWS